MNSLVFATANPNKIKEISQKLGVDYTFLSLKDIGCLEEVPETSATIEGNALQKARYIYENYGRNCFSEDSGLEIEALDGAPGVITAHYAGPARDAQANMKRVLSEMQGKEHRKARFKTVIALIIDGKEHLFEGLAYGAITHEQIGSNGFGYDPIFMPDGETRTFAQMSIEEKNKMSHRAKAITQLREFLSALED